MSTLHEEPSQMTARPSDLTWRVDTPIDRPLPILSFESRTVRLIGLFAAALAVLAFALFTFHFWAPADGGVDQNAYLLGGRMIAEHGSPRYTLTNPYQYVGGMFIRTSPITVKGGDYYPKYPFGLPLIYASYFWLFGATHAAKFAFATSPICAILAVAGMFFLARQICGSFAGVLAAILLGSSQLMIELSNNPNSHAACVCFIVWGMFFLVRWWQSGSIWRGILAGFLIGYAALIRYSEGLLILPIAVACASRIRWTDWKSYLRNALPGLAWAIPVGTMLLFNKHAMGSWTGYDSTNESEGFTWLKFKETWEQMIRTYYDMAAFFALPMGIAGIFLICSRSWKLGLMLILWLIPGTLLYTSYYWSPDRGISYARFILTFTPAVMLGAAISFHEWIQASGPNAPWYRKLPRWSAAIVVVFTSSAIGIYRSYHGLQQGQTGNGMMSLAEESRERKNLAKIGSELLDKVPDHSVLLADSNGGGGGGGGGNERALNYIQFLRHWDVYATDAFDAGGSNRRRTIAAGGPNGGGLNGGGNGGNGVNPDPNAAPTPRQKLQVEYLESLYEGKMPSQLHKDEADMIDAAFKAGRRVFTLVPLTRDSEVRSSFKLVGRYTISVVDKWNDLPVLPPDPVADFGSNNGANGRNRNRPPGGRGGGGAGGGNGGGAGGGFNNGRGGRGGGGLGGFGFGGAAANDPAPASWELLEITPDNSPVPVPVVRPSNSRTTPRRT